MRMTPLVFLLTAGILFGLPPASGATALTIPGTGACEATLRSVATVYERSHPQAKVVIPPSVHSEGGGPQGLSHLVFARDAIVFAVGPGCARAT